MENKNFIETAKMYDLIQTLNNWTKAYDEGQSLVSDKEWDELYFKLKQKWLELFQPLNQAYFLYF